MYRRQRAQGDGSLPKLPRIQNQRDIQGGINTNKLLPPINVGPGSHAPVGGGPSLSGRNLPSQQMLYSGHQQSYRSIKNRTRQIGQGILTGADVKMFASNQGGPYS